MGSGKSIPENSIPIADATERIRGLKEKFLILAEDSHSRALVFAEMRTQMEMLSDRAKEYARLVGDIWARSVRQKFVSSADLEKIKSYEDKLAELIRISAKIMDNVGYMKHEEFAEVLGQRPISGGHDYSSHILIAIFIIVILIVIWMHSTVGSMENMTLRFAT